MKRTIKLRPREADLPDRKIRLQIPGRLGADLDEYRDLYAQVHGEKIELAALIEGILEQFLASDRAFQRSRKSSTQPSQSGSDPALAKGCSP